MQCPKCQFQDTKVTDSRPEKDGRAIRRRRACEQCGFRFSTMERMELPKLLVQKRNGEKECFLYEKLERSIETAARKRPVSSEMIHELIRNLTEAWVGKDEITSVEIGDAALIALRKMDEVTFLRFASVYQQFESLRAFQKKLEEIDTENDMKN